MKIGVFDSGIGGLVIAKAFIKALPEYDFLYFGDTKNLPYGNKSKEQIINLTKNAIEFMIKKDCKIIILGCNTASCVALRYIQQQYLPKHHPEIKVLGVVIPTLEEALEDGAKNIGVIATQATINSKMYSTELNKINSKLQIQEVAAPELVPAIESNDFVQAKKIIKKYINKFDKIDSLILGCTHYPLIKEEFKKEFLDVNIIASDDFMGKKLKDYLINHPEIEKTLSKNANFETYISLETPSYISVAKKIFENIRINCI